MVGPAAVPYRDERASYDLVGTTHRLDESDRPAYPSKPDQAPSEAVRRV
jgi:hypothetical protein